MTHIHNPALFLSTMSFITFGGKFDNLWHTFLTLPYFCPQISRQKQALGEELVSVRKDCDRLSNQLQRISKEKEGLTQDKGELVVQVMWKHFLLVDI